MPCLKQHTAWQNVRRADDSVRPSLALKQARLAGDLRVADAAELLGACW